MLILLDLLFCWTQMPSHLHHRQQEKVREHKASKKAFFFLTEIRILSSICYEYIICTTHREIKGMLQCVAFKCVMAFYV